MAPEGNAAPSEKIGPSSVTCSIRWALVFVLFCAGTFFTVLSARGNTAARATAWLVARLGFAGLYPAHVAHVCLTIAVVLFAASLLIAFSGWCCQGALPPSELAEGAIAGASAGACARGAAGAGGFSPSKPQAPAGLPCGPAVGGRRPGLTQAAGSLEEQPRRRQPPPREEVGASEAARRWQQLQQQPQEGREAVLEPPPVRRTVKGEWTIHGMHEHQVLKFGLWQLDQSWPVAGLLDLPLGEVKSNALLRRRLIADLLAEKTSLQGVPEGDLAAAQRDLRLLTQRQLVRLRVLHLGSDRVRTLGAAQEGFLACVDRYFFERLGAHLVGALLSADAASGEVPPAEGGDGDEVLRRLGREAVFLTAAASAIPSQPWWVWWLDAQRRVFFHPGRCVVATEFPNGDGEGVLEVIDASKPDRQDPTGRLRWLDWRVTLITEEAQLSPMPRRIAAPEVSLTSLT